MLWTQARKPTPWTDPETRAEKSGSAFGSVIIGYERIAGLRQYEEVLLVVNRPPASFDACGLGRRHGSRAQGHGLLATSGLLLLALSFALVA